MPVFKIEHTARESTADLAVQAASILLLIGLLAYYTPPAQRLSAVALLLAGLAAWTLIEYCVHRFVLHGLRPWSTWHAQHHRHPLDLIFAPTVLIAGLFALLVFAPIFWLGGMWIACGLTLGVLSGYFLYSLTHLAVHQRTARSPWLRQRQRWHAEHHAQGLRSVGRFGVTTGFWDHVFAAAGRLGRQRALP